MASALLAAPGLAQTAVLLDFSQPQPSVIGVEVRTSPSFTEYRSGVWASPPSDHLTVGASSETAATNAIPAAPSAGCSQPTLPRYVPGLRRVVAIRRLSWWPAVATTECRYGLPTGLLDALVLHESQYLTSAVSRAGAVGLAQLMPRTAGELGVADARNPVANVDGGGRYLRAMMTKFRSVPLALAAYNAGPGAVRAAGGIPANSETPDYVRRILGYWSLTRVDDPSTLRRTALLLGFIDPKED